MPADLAHFLHRYKWVVLQHISAYLLINSRKSSRQSSTVALPETCLFSNTIALETQWHAGARTRDTLAPQAAFDWPRPAVTEHYWCESGGLHRCVAKTAPHCLTRVIWSCAWLRHDLVLKITLLTWRLTTGVSSCVVTWELMTTLWTFALSHWRVFFVNWQSSEFTVSSQRLHSPLPPLGHIWDVMLIWRRGNIEKTVYVLQYCVLHYNGAQRYEQFLQVGWLYRALILLGVSLCLLSASVSSIFMMLNIY